MKRLLGRVLLALAGWRDIGTPPVHAKYVLIAAPHTSNWDMVLMVAFAWMHGVNLSWIGKHTLFRGPFGPFIRALGGISIDRSAPQGLVAQMVEVFRQTDRLTVAVPPEGTRGRVEYWKSGFFRIAEAADVPIVFGVLDYASRRGGFGPAVNPRDGLPAIMERARAYYGDKTALYPGQFGPIRVRDESGESGESGRQATG